MSREASANCGRASSGTTSSITSSPSTEPRSVDSRVAQPRGAANGSRSVRRRWIASARARWVSPTFGNGSNSTAATWSGCVGSGNRAMVVSHRLRRSPPEDDRVPLHNLGSFPCPSYRWRARDACDQRTGEARRRQFHRQGWLLCSDGARQASVTASRITLRSGIVLVIPQSVFSRNGMHGVDAGSRVGTNGSGVLRRDLYRREMCAPQEGAARGKGRRRCICMSAAEFPPN